MKTKWGLVVFALSCFVGGCSDTLTVLDAQEANKSVAGGWKYASGQNFVMPGNIELSYLRFNEDGSGTVTYRDTTGTKALWCLDFFFSVISDNALTISTPFLGEYSMLFGYLQEYAVASDVLTLGSESNMVSTFEKVDEVPAEYTCSRFAGVVVTRDLSPAPREGSGLVYDGTRLWYLSDDSAELFPFDLTSKTVGTAVPWASARDIHAFQDPDVWTIGGSDSVAERRTTGDVVNKTIDTAAAPFSYQTDIDAMAWDGTNLWLHGDVTANDRDEFVKVDVDAGTKLEAHPFDISLNGLAWDGTYFWALTGAPVSPILKIDPDTFEAVATYYPPTADNPMIVEWHGIAAVDGTIYLLGVDEWESPNTAIIAQMMPYSL